MVLCLLEFLDRKNIERQLRLDNSGPIIQGRCLLIDKIEKELDLYFSGQLKIFNTPLKMIGTDFQKQVWQALQQIPFGQTCAYMDIARALGKPTAYRAVANANGANRLAIIIPCHRVINANGQLGGYASGLTRKAWLLKQEHVSI